VARQFAFLVAAGLVAGVVSASQGPVAHTAQVTLSDVRVRPADSGASTRLFMQISNETLRPIVLLGAGTPVAGRARLMARVAEGEQVDVGSWSIPASGELVLDPDTRWLEIDGLTRALLPGSHVPLVVHFTGGSVQVRADVREDGG
jgi:copper(I)-binding protein